MTRKRAGGYLATEFADPNADDAAPQFGRVGGFETMTLTLYVEKARKAQEAAALVPYTLRQAAEVFGLVYELADDGRRNALRSLAELCQRALESVAEKEGEALADLDIVLRCALDHHQAEEARAGKGKAE
jgi:hypothetical protein